MMATDCAGKCLQIGDRITFTAQHMEPPHGSGKIHSITRDGNLVVHTDRTHRHTYANGEPDSPTNIVLLFSRNGQFEQVVRK